MSQYGVSILYNYYSGSSTMNNGVSILIIILLIACLSWKYSMYSHSSFYVVGSAFLYCQISCYSVQDVTLIEFCDDSILDTEFSYDLLKHGHTIYIRFASRQKASRSIRIDEKF